MSAKLTIPLIKAVYAASQSDDMTQYEDAADDFDAVLYAHEDHIRRQALIDAERTLRNMRSAWGGDQPWMTTGTKIATLAGDVIKQLREDDRG